MRYVIAFSSPAGSTRKIGWAIKETLDKELCTLCGVCASECPAGAIALDPEPRFSGLCFDCLNCFCLCPEKTIKLPVSLEKMIEMIRNRSKTFNETPRTVVLYPE